MKKEDLKKLLIEGRTDFNPAKSIVKALIFLIIISCESYPQVPINGFCRYQSFDTDSAYSRILPLNYNEDSYTDLFLYSPVSDSVVAINGNQNGTFINEHRFKIPEAISDIQYLWNRSNKIYAYAFISRKQSSAGVLNFNHNGYPEISSKIRFNTYPENLSTGDINDDGIPELLVSGSAFNGLSLIFQEQQLREEKIVDKTSFSEAVFVDLNNDSYPDIAAFDIFSNKLQFLYNNSKGNFKKVREIPFLSPINSLQTTDLNLDSYADLIFSDEKSIDIFYGGFTSSYEDTVVIKTKYEVDKLITGDFNRDGKIDIAYTNRVNGTLSLIFAKDERKFFPELVYIKKNQLNDITSYYSKFINGIISLGNDKRFYLISNLSSLSDEVSIVAGAYPTTVSYFDKDNNSINDLCFIDGYNKTLNLLVRSSSGMPETWFPIPLFENENTLVIDNKLPQKKTFYCFARDKKLIEIIDVDFNRKDFRRSSLYSPGKIKDLKLQEKTGILYTAFTKDGNLGIAIHPGDRAHFSGYTISGISKNVTDASLSVYGKPVIFYSANNDTILIGERSIEGNQKNSEVKTGFPDNFNVNLFAGAFTNNGNPALYGFLSSQISGDFVFFLDPHAYVVSGKIDQPGGLRIKDKNQLFFGELRFNSPGRVCYFNQEQRNIKYLELKERNKIISRNLLLGNIDARSFFIKNMNTREFHVVYIDNDKNCITIRELK